MSIVERAERRRRSATLGLYASGVVLAFLIGGFPAALGAFIVVVGIAAVRRSRRARANIPRTACTFLVMEHGDLPIATLLFRTPDHGAEAATEHLRDRGWSILEPPLDGPLVLVGRVGVAFQGDRTLVVHDLRSAELRPSLVADRITDLPPGWGRAAQDSGYVLVLVGDDPAALGTSPILGAYALLRGTEGPGRP